MAPPDTPEAMTDEPLNVEVVNGVVLSAEPTVAVTLMVVPLRFTLPPPAPVPALPPNAEADSPPAPYLAELLKRLPMPPEPEPPPVAPEPLPPPPKIPPP